MRLRTSILAIALFGFALDRLLKQYVLSALALQRGVFVVDSVFGLRLHINEFFAWSLPIPNRAVLAVMLAVIAALGYALYKKRAHPEWMPLWLSLAGAVSNAIDRALYGGVVDYLVVPWGGVVNLADALVVAGVALLVFPRKAYAG